MRIFVLVIAFGVAACGNGGNESADRGLPSYSARAVDLCDLRVVNSLKAPDSYEGAMWQISEQDGFVTVNRPYTAENSFGATIKGRYTCVVKDRGTTIALLRTDGPLGSDVIIDDGTAPLSPKRLTQVEAGGERIAAIDPTQPDPKAKTESEIEWVANLTFSGCPEASDWFEMQKRVRAGDYTADLPSRCFKINPGDRLFANGHGHRETIENEGHAFERARTSDGRIFWSDSLDDISISPAS